jgi:hypothetical protein
MYEYVSMRNRLTNHAHYSFDQSNFSTIFNDTRRMPREARAAKLTLQTDRDWMQPETVASF